MKKLLYEYMDIIDPTNKFKNIEKLSEKNNKFTWEILVEDIIENVIINKDIDDFIVKIKKNIEIANTIYNDKILLKINKENQELFDNLQIKEINKEIKSCNLNKPFYKIQKEEIYKYMNIINMVNNKITNNIEQNVILDKLLKKNIIKLKVRINLIKNIYNNNNNNIVSYEDDLFINIRYHNDIIVVYDYINNKNKIYYDVKLPNRIIEAMKYDIKFNLCQFKNKHHELNIKEMVYLIIIIIDLDIFIIYQQNINLNLKYMLKYKQIYNLYEFIMNNFKIIINISWCEVLSWDKL